MIVSIDAKNAFGKTQYSLHDKNTQQFRNRKELPQPNK